jgi:DNA-binding LytR/AlgR family response regulator
MAASQEGLAGLRILVVEDNFLVAEDLRELLARLGCDVVGPAPRVEQGLDLVRQGKLDGAVLDINLGGEDCFPIAAALEERSVPFLFLTGYDDRTLIPAEYRQAPRLSKPVDVARLVSIARQIFAT